MVAMVVVVRLAARLSGHVHRRTTTIHTHIGTMLALALYTFAMCSPRSAAFEGSLLGVTARVRLQPKVLRWSGAPTVARLELWGLPLGGRLVGMASVDAATSAVVLDSKLERALCRRQVRVASLLWTASAQNVITVGIRLPFCAHPRYISLYPVDDSDGSDRPNATRVTESLTRVSGV